MKERFRNIAANWKSDITSGFVVSLVAMPLSLALASASGVPPIAGIISAVVGGIIVGLFGGSHITITGPGNGLAVVILTAVTTLGGGDMTTGYLMTLTAIIVSGAIIALFGFLKMGSLGDFFPSSAVQGILAAIGLILIARQFHIMVGVTETDGELGLGLLMDIPVSLIKLFKGNAEIEGAILGIISLGILVAHSRIHSKWLHIIPGPMWVLLLSIGFSYYFELTGAEFPIADSHMIQLPNDILKSFAFPDFSAFTQNGFISAVFGITLIVYIESLLSIRAVDRLDPERRRSNINKDLKALGLATIASGFAGGIPVVTVIARSSVNANNGARTGASNAIHGLCLMIFVVFLGRQLQMVPLAALAAILVYTGYKLAAPSVFKKIYAIGLQEFVVFLTTLLITISSDLVTGIVAGVLVSILMNVYHVRSFRTFFNHVIRPNTLLYQEMDKKYYLGVKGFSSFMNYLGLKKQLDHIPRDAEVIVDFSLAKYVDNSVLEHIHYYSEDQESKGGQMEVVGLDVHEAGSHHPFAARSMAKATKSLGPEKPLTARQEKFRDLAKEIGWKFSPHRVGRKMGLKNFGYFLYRRIDKIYNVFTGEEDGVFFQLMDVEFHQGEFIAQEDFKMTLLTVKLEKELPNFTLEKEWIFDRLPVFGDFEDIDFEDYPEFSKEYKLKGTNEPKIRSFFGDELLKFLELKDTFHVEANSSGLLIFKKERLATIQEVRELIDFSVDLVKTMERYSRQ